MDELNIQNMPLYESLDRDVFTKISNAICTNRYSLKRLSERYFLVSVEEFDFVYDKRSVFGNQTYSIVPVMFTTMNLLAI